MYQSLWHKYGHRLGAWPFEEVQYQGARLGEYAKPPVMGKGMLAGLSRDDFWEGDATKQFSVKKRDFQ